MKVLLLSMSLVPLFAYLYVRSSPSAQGPVDGLSSTEALLKDPALHRAVAKMVKSERVPERVPAQDVESIPESTVWEDDGDVLSEEKIREEYGDELDIQALEAMDEADEAPPLEAGIDEVEPSI